MKYQPLRKLPKVLQNKREDVSNFLRVETDYIICAISEGDSVTSQLVAGEQFYVENLSFIPNKVVVVASIRNVHNFGMKDMYVIPTTTVTVYEG